MRIFERIEGQIAFVFHTCIAPIIGNYSMRKFMEAERKYPADQDDEEGEEIVHKKLG